MATAVLTPPRALSRTVTRRVLVTALFVALAAINTYPLVFQLDSAIGQHGDSYFSVWRLAWVAHQVVADPLHLFDGNIFYPEHSTLAFSDAMLLPSLVLAPLHWAGLSPVAIYNVTLLATFVLSGVAAYALVRHLTASTSAGVLAGVIFAFSPYRLQHFDHLELQFAFWIPLAVLAWHRAIDGDRPVEYLKVAAFAAGQILSCIYYGVFLCTWLAFVTLVWFIRQPRRALRAGALVLLLPAIVLAAYSIPYLASRQQVGERRSSEVAIYSVRAGDFLSAPASNLFYGWTDRLGENERHLFPGVVAAVLLIVGLWPPPGRAGAVHAAGLGLAIVLAVGFNSPVYRVLYDWVLPYRGLRVPARAGILILLGTAVFAGFGLARLRSWGGPKLAAGVAALLIAIACGEYASSPAMVPVNRRFSEWYRWLRTVPGAVVFEWPVTVPWRLYIMRDVEYMFHSTLHWRPLLNGYSGFYPRSYLDLLVRMRSFPDSGSIKELQARGATIVILHEVAGSRPSYDYALARLARDSKFRVLAQDRDLAGRISVFELIPRSAAARALPR